MSQIESLTQASSALPEDLLNVVRGISSSSVDAPRQLPHTLEGKLHAIANHYGGQVQLHGRLFAQWLHYAFPNECPYPVANVSLELQSAAHWGKKSVASDEDIEGYLKEMGETMLSLPAEEDFSIEL